MAFEHAADCLKAQYKNLDAPCNKNCKLVAELQSESQRLREALDTAKAALHHCDIRHKKCSCSKEALDEIAAAIAGKKEEV